MRKAKPRKKALDLAVSRIGSPARLAKRLGVSRQAVQQWRCKDVLPARHVLAVEELSGMSRYELRPDIFGEPAKPHAECHVA